ncbi:vacuolar family H+-ATPase subunit H [Eubacterium sp.]|uniref:vacuolar family H+-ATPase subunit H n=1 Tax=Eubacterium sp. TaxID=142586 RepID=UPI0039A0A808
MSKIEQIITEIEEYIDNCKFQPLSTTKIVVNKDDIDELLAELRLRTPDEIKKYQKIIANKDAILNDAKERSEAMIAEATAHINQLVSEHEIMQKAYNEANQIIEQAQQQAQDILGKATNEANDLRTRAMQYTDDILANVQSILSTGMDSFEHAQSEMMTSLNSSLNVVVESRKELGGQDEEATDEQTDDDDITVDLL